MPAKYKSFCDSRFSPVPGIASILNFGWLNRYETASHCRLRGTPSAINKVEYIVAPAHSSITGLSVLFLLICSSSLYVLDTVLSVT